MECARKELGEIQRRVCLCVTGAIKTTATADLEILFNSNIREPRGELFTDQIFDMLRDKQKPETDFSSHFEISLPDRFEWSNGLPGLLGGERHVGFTDGSKMSEGTGADLRIPELATYIWFHGQASIFQAEIVAMIKGSLNMISPVESGKGIII